MKIKLDENVTSSAAPVLRALGHDVDTVAEEGLMGADDPTVLAAATDDGRLLVSLDRGLGDVRAYPPGTHGGILVIRLDHQSPQRVREAMQLIATAVDLASLAGGVSVWRNGTLRRRPAPTA